MGSQPESEPAGADAHVVFAVVVWHQSAVDGVGAVAGEGRGDHRGGHQKSGDEGVISVTWKDFV